MIISIFLAGAAAAWLPGTINWGSPAADGTKFALLEGQRDKAGETFSYAFALPGGYWDRPHCHSQDARVFVSGGELYLGWGSTVDRASAMHLPVGSYVLVPAGVLHYEGSNKATTFIGTAKGAWQTHYQGGGGSAGTPTKTTMQSCNGE